MRFWIALAVTVIPFVATPLVADALIAEEHLRYLSVGLASAMTLVGLALGALLIGVVSKTLSRQVGSGILVGLAVGIVAGSLTCGAVMYQAG